MKLNKIIYLIFLTSCLQPEPTIPDVLPEINLATAYPISDTEVNITANLLVKSLKNMVDYGVVWAENQQPTINDNIITVGSINTGTQYQAKIQNLKQGSTIFVRALTKKIDSEINYSNEITLVVRKLTKWRRMADLPIKEGQFTGVVSKIDHQNLYFLRLDQNNEWELWKHFHGIYRDPNFTWQLQKFPWPQVSPRIDPLFFTVNFNQDYSRPAAFLGGGYISNPQFPNLKTYVKDFYWVYDTQNFLEPIPLGDGPVAHFTLNRKEYFLEENKPDKFWSYFALEPFLPQTPFPKLEGNYHYLGTSTDTKGYILAEKKDESQVLLFEYDDKKDSWLQKASFPQKGRQDGVVFSLYNKIYYGLGRNTSPLKGLSDIWEFDPIKNTWKFHSNYPGAGNIKVMASGLGDYAVLFGGYQLRDSGVGSEKYYTTNDTWEFVP
jgi:hypothetical protein